MLFLVCLQPRSKHDLYKQVLSLKIQHAIVRYVPNEDHESPMTTRGEALENLMNARRFALTIAFISVISDVYLI
jgi:hypothetical protein